MNKKRIVFVIMILVVLLIVVKCALFPSSENESAINSSNDVLKSQADSKRETTYLELLNNLITHGKSEKDINYHATLYTYEPETINLKNGYIYKLFSFKPNSSDSISKYTELSYAWSIKQDGYFLIIYLWFDGCSDTFICHWDYKADDLSLSASGDMLGINYNTYNKGCKLPDILNFEGETFFEQYIGDKDIRSEMINSLNTAMTDFSDLIDSKFNIKVSDLGFANFN